MLTHAVIGILAFATIPAAAEHWAFEGNGCCWNPGEAGRPDILFDKALGADTQANQDACAAKCRDYGSSQCRLFSFIRGWCSVYKYTGQCPHLHAQPGDCGSSGVGARTYYLANLAATDASNTTLSVVKTPVAASQWEFEGNGCCWNPGEAGRPDILFDGALGADTLENQNACAAKCMAYGSSQCRLFSFIRGWCSVYRYTGQCPHLHAQPGDCGSSGVGARTYYLANLAATDASNVTLSVVKTTAVADGWEFEGNGCCWNPGEAGRPDLLFDGPLGADTQANQDACAAKCMAYGSSQCRLYSFIRGWCSVYRYTEQCPHLHDQPGDCGSSGVGARTYYLATVADGWEFEGNGCCWNPGEAGRPDILFDGPLGADTLENQNACATKCRDYGSSQCRLISFIRGWCSVYKYTGQCPHLHAQPGDCGSSGVGARTYYLATISRANLNVANTSMHPRSIMV